MNSILKYLFVVVLLFSVNFVYALTIELNTTNFPCGTTNVSAVTGCNFQGALEISANGNPDGVVISNISMINGGAFSFDITVSPLAPAFVSLKFKILTSNDPTGCALPNAEDDVDVEIACACNVQLIVTTQDESCYECLNGSATAVVTGGTQPIMYNWSHGATGATVENLPPGPYTLIIEDADGCVATTAFNILAYNCAPFSAIVETTNALCHHDCNGILEITGLTNNSTEFSVLWGDGSSELFLSDLCAATYQVTVTDKDLCTITSAFTIAQPPLILFNVDTIVHVTPAHQGQIVLSAPTPNPNYTYYIKFDGVEGESNATGIFLELNPGCYTVGVKDQNGCSVERDSICVLDMTSSSKQVFIQDLKVYPNPANHIINIQHGEDNKTFNEVIIYRVDGIIVEKKYNTNQIDVSHLDSGVYFFGIQIDGYIQTAPVYILK